MVDALQSLDRIAAFRRRRAARGLAAALALFPLSLAWGHSAPVQGNYMDLPYTAADPMGSCNRSGCHASTGAFGDVELTLSLPAPTRGDVPVLAFDDMTMLAISAESSSAASVANAGFGFHLRASMGTFAGTPSGISYFAADGVPARSATHAMRLALDTVHDLWWQPPDDVFDGQEVTFHHCHQVVNGDGENTGDGPSACSSSTVVQVNQPPQIADQSVSVAHNSASPVELRLTVSAGAAPRATACLKALAPLPTKGAVARDSGDDLSVSGPDECLTGPLALTYLPNANAEGADSMRWSASDGLETVEATVSFSIAAAPAPPSSGGGGGCALASAASAPAGLLWWLAPFAALRLRRRARPSSLAG